MQMRKVAVFDVNEALGSFLDGKNKAREKKKTYPVELLTFEEKNPWKKWKNWADTK